MGNEVEEWLRLREEKVSLTKIAELYKTSRETVRRRLMAVGAFTGEFYKSAEFDCNTILEQYSGGKSISEIARQNNCTRGTVARFLTGNGIALRGRDEQVYIEKSNGLRKTVNRNFFDSWSNEMAYVLGWMVTDGCVLSNLTAFHITSTDIDHLKKLATLMETDVKISSYSGDGNSRTAGRLSIGSKYMVEKLISLGVTPRKTKSVQVPLVPDEYLSHFFRGVFEGDGTIFVKNNQATLHIYNSSDNFLPELNKRVSTVLGIKEGSIYKEKRYGAYTLYFGGHKRITHLFNSMYEGTPMNMILERKYNKFLEYFKTKAGDTNAGSDKHSGPEF